MTDKKVKIGITPSAIIGIVFTSISAVFMLITVIFFLQNEATLFLIAISMLFVGIITLIAGLTFFLLYIRKRKRIRKIVEEGYYITAEIGEVSRNYNVQVNGRNPYNIRAAYTDETGCVHIFQSRNLYYNPEGMLRSQMVRVYIRRNEYKEYYMDIDAILPQVEFHK